MGLIRKNWDFWLSAVLTAGALWYLPSDALEEVTTELIAFFSIQSAVIFPAMIMTAGILKADGLELEDATRYHKALKSQMIFWVVLLGLNFAAVVFLILGKAIGWSLEFFVDPLKTSLDFDLAVLGLFYFFGSLAAFRTIPFVRGVFSLLELNSEMTQKAIKRRNKNEADGRRATIGEPMVLPAGYGAVIPARRAGKAGGEPKA